MRVDLWSQQLGIRLPAATAAAVVATIGLVIVGAIAMNADRLPDVSAQRRSYPDACIAISSRSSADCQQIQPLLLEPELRSLDGATHHG
jgi:hypothetical protein